MAEIKVTLLKDVAPVVCLSADLSDCPQALRTLGLLLPALRLVRFLDAGAVDGKEPRADTASGAGGIVR